MIVAAGYLAAYLNRGWVAHDEGAFAQSAERVLQGELPHRDFDELYSGGLTFANALAFKAFGMRLTSLRIALFMVFVPWTRHSIGSLGDTCHRLRAWE